MSNYKDSIAYSFYKRAKENLESGIAVENLVEQILKEVLRVVDFGGNVMWFDSDDYLAKIRYEAIGQLRSMGFKVTQSEHRLSELHILWDFSEEDAEEEDNNANEN